MSIKRGIALCKIESINKTKLYGAIIVINMTTPTKWKPYFYRRKSEYKFSCILQLELCIKYINMDNNLRRGWRNEYCFVILFVVTFMISLPNKIKELSYYD